MSPARASPSRAKPKTVVESARPGNTDGHHWPVTMFAAPMAIMDPHSGVGTRTPAPTNDKPAEDVKADRIRAEPMRTTGRPELGACRAVGGRVGRDPGPHDRQRRGNGGDDAAGQQGAVFARRPHAD